MKLPEGYNRHHSAWPARHYKSRIEKLFRGHNFLINGMIIEPHNTLHAVMQPPLKLTAEQMTTALCLLEDMNGEPLQAHERILHLSDHLHERSLREQKVAANFRVQAEFIQAFGI